MKDSKVLEVKSSFVDIAVMFKAYLVDCDKNGEGLKGFRRFKNLAKATLYAYEKNGTLYREYQDGSTEEV